MTEQLAFPDAYALMKRALDEKYLLDFLSDRAADSIVDWLARDASGFAADQPITRLFSISPLRSHALGALLSVSWHQQVGAACQDAIEEHWRPYADLH